MSKKVLKSFPKYELVRGKLVTTSVTKRSLKKLDSKKYWRILYKDISDTITIRTIFSPTFIIKEEENDDGEILSIDFLEANCILRNEELRYFNIDRIILVQELDVNVNP